jgi:hypothetical protein
MRPSRSRGFVALVVLAALGRQASGQSDPRADVVFYGDHRPTTFLTGATFESPFDYREFSNDVMTRVAFDEVPGMRNQVGTLQWGLAAYGKYVFVGFYKYEQQFAPEGQSLGIFDSERHRYYLLNISSQSLANRGVVVANPTARKSRVFFAGSGDVFGYVAADLDQEPTAWIIRAISRRWRTTPTTSGTRTSGRYGRRPSPRCSDPTEAQVSPGTLVPGRRVGSAP